LIIGEQGRGIEHGGRGQSLRVRVAVTLAGFDAR
jgi:hypothetical protein